MTLVERLVRCPSPSGSEADATKILLDEMSQHGFDAHIDQAGNVIGRIGTGTKQVYLVGHIDTVPGDIRVRVEDGILYGRGSVDAKGSLAAFVEAAKEFTESDRISITVIGCVDEEAESLGAHHILETREPADLVVIGEPSGWDAITLGYKGSLSLRYSLKQPSHHMGADVATPAEGAIGFYRELCDSFPNIGSGFDALSINVKALNTSSDGLRDKVDMNLNLRTPLNFAFAELQGRAESLSRAAELEWSPFTPAVLSDKKNELVRAFLGAIRAHGGEAKFKRKTGTSDMNLLAQWGCPIVAYGPGDSKLDHTPDEHLNLAEYEKAIDVLIDVLSITENC